MLSGTKRNDARSRFSVDDRVFLAEQDLDAFDEKLDAIKTSVARLTGIALGILVALTTNAVIMGLGK